MALTTKRKQYHCSWEDCGKTFTRSDHLQRHVLNHRPGGRTCPRCNLHFKRPDLLDRHLLRHRQKDEEAGGTGLGVVESRKKLWQDADGNIISKRPLPAQINTTSKKQATSSIRDVSYNQHETEAPIAPISPLQSLLSTESSEAMMQTTTQQDPLGDLGGSVVGLDMFNFLANSTWGADSSQLVDNAPEMPFGDIFNPDTASSFNMPFTTMANYDWLFEMSENAPTLSSTHQLGQVTMTTNDSGPEAEREQHSAKGNPHAMELDSHANAAMTIPPPQGTLLGFIGREANPVGLPLSQDLPLENSIRGSLGDQLSWQSSLANMYSQPQARDKVSTAYTDGRLADSASTPGFYCPTPTSLPYHMAIIDNDSHSRLLDLIELTKPVTPMGTLIDRHHPLLAISCLQTYLDLYFSHFNRVYPLLHRPTFDPAQTQTLLLLAVLCLGATYGDKSVHTLAVCIHDGMRGQVFQHAAFTATPELWMLQTILLIECFGKSRAGQKQHDMAHLFHGLLINLIRRSDCQSVATSSLPEAQADLEPAWRKFIDTEHRKRLAFFCFLWDTQHAVLFSQSLCMSSFELRIVLPCSQATWEAESAHEWLGHARQEKPIPFLAALKTYVNVELHTCLPELESLSRLLVLHGLMSIQWDMKRRDQSSLGVARFRTDALKDKQRWQECLERCYEAWKADFDTFCMNMTMSLSENSTAKDEFIRFSTATTAIYHTAHITLNVEVLDLQIYAGARHILGRTVTKADSERSRAVIHEWAKSNGCTPASKASWHAAHLLREGIMNLSSWDVNNAFHYPWCLYLSVLTCWAFHFANFGEVTKAHTIASPDHVQHRSMVPANQQHNDDKAGDKVSWHTKLEMNALVSSISGVRPENVRRVLGRHSPSGLVTVMAEHLSHMRWAIVHEGVKVLKSLSFESTATALDSESSSR